jgi:hypothetical protein
MHTSECLPAGVLRQRSITSIVFALAARGNVLCVSNETHALRLTPLCVFATVAVLSATHRQAARRLRRPASQRIGSQPQQQRPASQGPIITEVDSGDEREDRREREAEAQQAAAPAEERRQPSQRQPAHAAVAVAGPAPVGHDEQEEEEEEARQVIAGLTVARCGCPVLNSEACVFARRRSAWSCSFFAQLITAHSACTCATRHPPPAHAADPWAQAQRAGRTQQAGGGWF